MQEDFLHYIWKFRKFCSPKLKTSSGEFVQVFNPGIHNFNSGPDFIGALVEINEIKWAGNIELHINSSDWNKHKHSSDSNYESVILHVVWNHDTEIKRLDGSYIPVLELKKNVKKDVYISYKNFIQYKHKWLPCENQIQSVKSVIRIKWLERLFFERLEFKSEKILRYYQKNNNDWEATLFKLLIENFGLKINQASFLSIAESLPFEVFRKLFNDLEYMEAVLFGQAKLLTIKDNDDYQKRLLNDYNFLKHKYKISDQSFVNVTFFRLRPQGFPTIRLSQFANLYVKHKSIFSNLLNCKTLNEYYELFDVKASKYWETHYNFGKKSKKRKTQLTTSFIDKIILNTILPLKYIYGKTTGCTYNDEITNLINELKSESNTILKKYSTIGISSKNAMESQALIQLNYFYCNKKKCLNCDFGVNIISN